MKTPSDETMGRLFDWLADSTSDLTDAEVRQELDEAGIDTTEAVRKVRELIASRQTQTSLREDRRAGPSIPPRTDPRPRHPQ